MSTKLIGRQCQEQKKIAQNNAAKTLFWNFQG